MNTLNQRRRLCLKTGLGGLGLLSGLVRTGQATEAFDVSRLVVVGGGVTEMVYELGVGSSVVGVDTTSTYPELVKKLPSVGYLRALSLEGMMSLHPSLILFGDHAGPPHVLAKLQESRLPVMQLRTEKTFDGMCRRYRTVGEVLGCRDRAQERVTVLSQEWRHMQTHIQQHPLNMRVLYVMGHHEGQWLVAGKNTSAETMMEYLGVQNAVQDFEGYRTLQTEYFMSRPIDWVITAGHQQSAQSIKKALQRSSDFKKTTAGNKDQIIVVDTLAWLGFGPRMGQAVSSIWNTIQATQ